MQAQPSDPQSRTAYQVQTPEQVGLLELDEDGLDEELDEELDEDGGLLELDEELDEDELEELDEELDELGGLLLDAQPTGVGSLMYQ